MDINLASRSPRIELIITINRAQPTFDILITDVASGLAVGHKDVEAQEAEVQGLALRPSDQRHSQTFRPRRV